MTRPVAVLLSIGRHPASLRPWRAARDATACELALRLNAARTIGIHAGRGAEQVLRDYAAMGLTDLIRIDVPAGEDTSPHLAAFIAALTPSIVLAGDRSEDGDQSGHLPYLLAHALGVPIVPGCVSLAASTDGWVAVVAEPGGQRRRLAVAGGCVATVGAAGPAPRYPAHLRRLATRIVTVPAGGEVLPLEHPVRIPARSRPRPMRMAPATASAAERLAAATTFRSGQRRVVTPGGPEEAAALVLAALDDAGVTPAATQEGRQ
jgi:electron transfer flavoprotein beta subunit